MADKSKIEWTDATWNPVRGCTRVSRGCEHCYAEAVAARFSGPGMAYEGLAKRVGGEPRWTGEVRLIPEKLDQPLRWKRSRRVFVNSMSDLFHERLAFEGIAAVFGVMTAAHQHTFQVLTKRPKRALEFFEWTGDLSGWPRLAGCEPEQIRLKCWGEAERLGVRHEGWIGYGWPLPNVWLGVSAEDQKTADERIPLLLQCPAAVRFVSYEPALGPVDFAPWLPSTDGFVVPDWPSTATGPVHVDDGGRGLDWIIVGGESGRQARPFDVAWARSTVEQCQEAGVACFVKQFGARPAAVQFDKLADWPDHVEFRKDADNTTALRLRDSHGGDWSEWPEDLRVRQYPRAGTRP